MGSDAPSAPGPPLRLRAAIEKYREALKALPDYEAAMLNLGPLLPQTGQSAEAVGLLERLVAIDPELAVAHFEEALRLRPDYAQPHYGWGLALEELGRFEEAATHYREAVRLAPNYAAARYRLGVVLALQGESRRGPPPLEREREPDTQ